MLRHFVEGTMTKGTKYQWNKPRLKTKIKTVRGRLSSYPSLTVINVADNLKMCSTN